MPEFKKHWDFPPSDMSDEQFRKFLEHLEACEALTPEAREIAKTLLTDERGRELPDDRHAKDFVLMAAELEGGDAGDVDKWGREQTGWL